MKPDLFPKMKDVNTELWPNGPYIVSIICKSPCFISPTKSLNHITSFILYSASYIAYASLNLLPRRDHCHSYCIKFKFYHKNPLKLLTGHAIQCAECINARK